MKSIAKSKYPGCGTLSCRLCKYFYLDENSYICIDAEKNEEMKVEDFKVVFSDFIKILIDPNVKKYKKKLMQERFPEFVERLEKGE